MYRSADILRFESQMLRLDHEILSLKFMVEEAKPDVMADCYKYVQLLRHRYETLQSHFQAFKEDESDIHTERFTTIDQALQELSLLVGSTSLLLRFRLADSFYYRVV